MTMGLRIIALALLVVSPAAAGGAGGFDNALPAEFAKALAVPDSAEIYSLEPTKGRLPEGQGYYGYTVLGHAPLRGADIALATREFQRAIADWQGVVAGCFEPRQALDIRKDGHRYDFVICYACGELAYYKDGVYVDDTPITGSPVVLKDLLRKRHVTPSHSDADEQRHAAREEAAATRDLAYWVEAMPPYLLPVWEKMRGDTVYAEPFEPVLRAREPDERARIRALLRWLGPKRVDPETQWDFESIPGELLLAYPTADIASALEDSADAMQWRGAVRYFESFDFARKHPGELASLPPALKARLLDAEKPAEDLGSEASARKAFGPAP